MMMIFFCFRHLDLFPHPAFLLTHLGKLHVNNQPVGLILELFQGGRRSFPYRRLAPVAPVHLPLSR